MQTEFPLIYTQVCIAHMLVMCDCLAWCVTFYECLTQLAHRPRRIGHRHLTNLGDGEGEGTRYKRPYGDGPPKWVAKSGSWYMYDPLLKMQDLVYEWVDFYLRKFWKNHAQNLAQNWTKLVYEWVTFSWKIGICMGSTFKFCGAHPYQNQTWVPPRTNPIF